MIKAKIIKVGLAVFFAAATTFVSGQNYNITPDDTLNETAPYNSLYHFNILQNNLTSGVLVFSWQQIAVNIPAGWDVNLCDNGHCYTGMPLSGTMDTVFNGDYGLMSIGVNPFAINGTSEIQYAVWEANTPWQKDTLTWIITANGITGINEIENEKPFMWINHNQVRLNKVASNFQFIRIIDTNGKIVLSKTLNKVNEISLPALSNSVYSIQLLKDQNIYFQKFFYQK